ncbi:site-specific integrase [Streptococcus suis]|uniref:Site-specific integrase n=1 Tax=Streptococcus suis TaxID=1307 RepID=A0A9X4MRA0_STRSU|nr:site-specific integrase [Streptococcus suis]MBY5024547.1 site-specific integrase [Streptococcus suis]MCK3935343.1 site-specific integrase [Streptococcus suis]MDG4525917.1 site-specific integrase [Streptococcus suis]MDG4528303.1 site-specific integrase [Streptococcus suis]QZT17198.1 site-specific integrase [Streptococcus suis]
MVSYRKRSNGWEYRISYKKPDGTYGTLPKGGFKTKADAVIAASQAQIDLADNVIIDKNITLADYFESWATVHKKPHVDPVTYEKYEFTYKKILEYFPDVKMHRITPTSYQNVLNLMSDRFVKDTIKRINSHIRAALKVAIYEGTLKKDFTTLAKVHSNVDSKDEADKFIELEEYLKLIAHSRKNIKHQSHFFIYLVSKTGLRPAEAQGLTTDDMLDILELVVNKSYKINGKNKGWRSTKNKQSKRRVPYDNEVWEVYQEYLKVGYISNPEKRLFVRASDTAIKKIIRKRVSNKLATPHSLRHTYVSYLKHKGIDILTISKLIGHKDVLETLRTYTHLFQDQREEDFEKVRQLF